jgi:hypothetical protein
MRWSGGRFPPSSQACIAESTESPADLSNRAIYCVWKDAMLLVDVTVVF